MAALSMSVQSRDGLQPRQLVPTAQRNPRSIRSPMMGKTTQWIDRVSREGPPELRLCYGDPIAAALKSTNKIDQHTGIDANKAAGVIAKR